MATYKEIQVWVKQNYGFSPKTCWIAHVKEICGLKAKPAWNRAHSNKRQEECPIKKQEAIKKSLNSLQNGLTHN
ncbi:MAG: hypothetical protein ACFFAJ_09300 [Candidatus Hodarchaeota archaeon]